MEAATNVTWDLSDLYDSIDDPRIESALAALMNDADAFAEKYRGKVNSPDLTADTLLSAIRELECIYQEVDKPYGYASLRFSGDTSDPALGSFLQHIRESTSQIAIKLMFFDLELMALPEEQVAALVQNPSLAHYKHFIWASRLFRDHRLSEAEERILEERANTGRRAFGRLFEETVSNIPFKMSTDGEERTLTLPEVTAMLREPEREARRAAAETLTTGLVDNGKVLTFIFNTLIQDKAVEDRLRRYSYPEESRHLSNELDRDTVEVVIDTAVRHYPDVSRYYNLKREILGYDKLTHYDRYAPLFSTTETVPYEKAKEIILSSFGRFSPVLSETADLFFRNNWIDAGVRKGKRGGAFCSYMTPDLHPYVFMSYLNKMEDVSTLGHELGHAAHAYLAREQGYLNFSPVLPVAELASTFGEMLVFDSLREHASREDKLALYAEKIEGAFATIFRQAAMFRFEQEIHAHRREKGELTTEEFSAIWQRQQQAMFGESLKLGEEHRFWWMYVSHFISTPFYVYAYTFGELLVMALYAMYLKEGDAFPPKYIELLKIGGAVSPAEMLGRVGIDIKSPAFWEGGLDVLSSLIADFEQIYHAG